MDKQYEVLVAAGKKAANVQWELGDLALKVETKYSEGSLAQYADDIGVGYDALRKYRLVSGAFSEKERHRSNSWTIHEVFAAQEDRLELIKKAWTVREARNFLHQRANPDPEPDEDTDEEDLEDEEEINPEPNDAAEALWDKIKDHQKT